MGLIADDEIMVRAHRSLCKLSFRGGLDAGVRLTGDPLCLEAMQRLRSPLERRDRLVALGSVLVVSVIARLPGPQTKLAG